MVRPGWFVDVDVNCPVFFVISLETGDGYIPDLSRKFSSREDAEEFLQKYVLPAGRLDD